jgi:hypothetical protein
METIQIKQNFSYAKMIPETDINVNIKVDLKFKKLVTPLTQDEKVNLEKKLVNDGVGNLTVWSRLMSEIETARIYGGLCKSEWCHYNYIVVPASKWIIGDGIWECPECGYGIAPWEYNYILLDNHDTLDICARLGIPCNLKDIEFGNRREAANWIDKNQLATRNLTNAQRKIIETRIQSRAFR